MIKICAGTKRLSSDPEDQPLLGDASAEFKVFLPKEKCQATTGKAFQLCKIWYFLPFLLLFGCFGHFFLLNTPENQPLLGDASAEFKVFLPKEKCQATTGKDNKNEVELYTQP